MSAWRWLLPPERSVLVIDDADDIRMLLRMLLERGGCRVFDSPTGMGAEQLVAEHKPDLVLLDVQMPDRDGWDVLAAIRSHRTVGDVPVILCTVKSSTADRIRGWELGADGYLTKPFSLDQVLAEIDAVANRPSAQRMPHRVERVHDLQQLQEVTP